jgi:hypothetical protein
MRRVASETATKVKWAVNGTSPDGVPNAQGATIRDNVSQEKQGREHH